jgi:hypothetical protein
MTGGNQQLPRSSPRISTFPEESIRSPPETIGLSIAQTAVSSLLQKKENRMLVGMRFREIARSEELNRDLLTEAPIGVDQNWRRHSMNNLLECGCPGFLEIFGAQLKECGMGFVGFFLWPTI